MSVPSSVRLLGRFTPSFLGLGLGLGLGLVACSTPKDVSVAVGEITASASAAATALETIPEGEDAAIKHIAETIAAQVKREFEASQEAPPVARRDAHAKHHGCVKAQFDVSADVPADLRAGVFQPSKHYDAWIRFSNGNGKVKDDHDGDARGMAVKLVGVAGEKILDGADRNATTQDFLMINHPNFFVRNAADYVVFNDVVARDGDPRGFFFPGINPFAWRVQEGLIANAIQSEKVSNPLEARYFTMAPYLLGASAVKVSARPCTATAVSDVSSASKDYLREAMASTLAQKSACFELLVQTQRSASSMPVEDPTVEWSERESPFRKVGTLTIPKQSFDSAAQMTYCENLSFSPWHSLPDHRPLGGINRVRRTVYETIARVRHELNGAAKSEPTDLQVPGQ